ncbi:MAG: twin transmembrane helix small protein [Hyphomicrobiaceae bacterium]
MGDFFYALTPFAVAAVAIVLLLGLWNMLRGGSANLSQKLMRWRVGLQFVAICILLAALYLGS